MTLSALVLSLLVQSSDLQWAAVSGGCFQMGTLHAYPEERPVRDICLQPYEMTVTEVTVGQFAEFVTDTGYVTRAEKGWSKTDPNGPGVDIPPGSAIFDLAGAINPTALNWWTFKEGASWQFPRGPDGGKANPLTPVVHLTRADAEAYAEWVGARLPSEAEWEYAARMGEDGRTLQWSDAEKQALNNRANTWQGLFPVHDSGDDGHTGLAAVGQYAENPVGLYDMIGNAWEWTASPYAPSHAEGDRRLAGESGLDFTQPNTPVGTIKGGSFLCAFNYCVRFRPAARQAQNLYTGTSHIGFRVVRDRSPCPSESP